MSPPIPCVLDLLDVALKWLRDVDDLDAYETSIVETSREKLLDVISNLEGLL